MNATRVGQNAKVEIECEKMDDEILFDLAD